jgi:hypothetical protein
LFIGYRDCSEKQDEDDDDDHDTYDFNPDDDVLDPDFSGVDDDDDIVQDSQSDDDDAADFPAMINHPANVLKSLPALNKKIKQVIIIHAEYIQLIQ